MPEYQIHHGDCLDVMRQIDADSIDAVVTDPPYFKVKKDSWDRQWDDVNAFVAWFNRGRDEWHRVLKPNGSIYCFAWPKLASRVELAIGEKFNVLNRITWRKPAFSTKAEMSRKGDLRSFFPASESIIFAEHHGADVAAKGESGFGRKCDELRGFVFEPLRAYFDGERERSGLSIADINHAWRVYRGVKPGINMAGHWFSPVQWMLPTKANYEWLRNTLSDLGRNDEYLRREYEELRREYEELRRPFVVTADVPYTDVWDFPTVAGYPGKHPCEKPQSLLEHMITTSTRPGAVVLDPFAGSGSTGVACMRAGRNFVGVERDAEWLPVARARIEHERAKTPPIADAG